MKTHFIIWICIILLFSSKIYAQPCGAGSLPTSLPDNLTELEIANKTIATCFAPIIHAMTDNDDANSANGRGDLITSAFYDGDFNTGNNWESLSNYQTGNASTRPQLNPVVYHSVVWTATDWVITYAFYHPRDYAGTGWACCPDNHENDLEGAIFVVSRSTFIIRKIATISHTQLLSFISPTISDIFIDNGTHAVEANVGNGCINFNSLTPPFLSPCDDCNEFSLPHITYTPGITSSITAETSSNGNQMVGSGTYILEDIFGLSPFSLNSLTQNPH